MLLVLNSVSLYIHNLLYYQCRVLHQGNYATSYLETPGQCTAVCTRFGSCLPLQVVMNIDGFSLPLEGQARIVIGNIPFAASSLAQRSHSPSGPGVESDIYSDERPLLPSSDDSCPHYYNMRKKRL